MFYSIQGKVEHIEQNLAVIETSGGVSYAVGTSRQTSSNLKRGETVRLYTFLNIRENACELFGFATREELSTFKQLTGISGVGAKYALSILSIGTPEKLALAIISEDEQYLIAAPGVGKKLAGRIILELRDKLAKTASTGSITAAYKGITSETSPLAEAQAALCVLGYTPSEAATAISGLPEGLSVEELIRGALKNLAG